MKRPKIPGLVDLVRFVGPIEIKTLADDPGLDRRFETGACLVNWLLLKRSLSVPSFGGDRFPTMGPRGDQQRAQRQLQFWGMLNDRAATIQSGPDELEPLASLVREVGSDA